MALGEIYTIDGSGRVSLKHGYNGGWRATWRCIVPGSFGGAGGSDLLFYDPVEGTGEFYTMYQNGTLSLIKAFRAGWRKTWHTIVAGKFGGSGQTDLLFYDRSDGTVETYQVSAQCNISPLKAYRGTWGKSWDLVVPGNFGGGPATDLLFYDRTAGTGAFYCPDGQGNLVCIREVTGGWRKTWDIITAGPFGPGPYSGLLFYDRQNKTGALYSTDGQGNLTLLKQYADWRSSWSQIVPLSIPGGFSPCLLFYDPDEGTLVVYDVDRQGNLQERSVSAKEWRTSWTRIVPCPLGGRSQVQALLFYSPVAFTLPADPGETQTGITLKRGDRVTLQVDGTMAVVGYHGPGGIHELASAGWPEPGLRRFCAYAHYGRECLVPVPNPQDESKALLRFTAFMDGALSLHINDDSPRGRTGRFEVDIAVRPGDPPAVQPLTCYIPADAGQSGTATGSETIFRGLNEGDVLVVEAFGRMACGSPLDESGPSGDNNGRAPAHFPVPGFPPQALYVEIGSGSQVKRRLPLEGQKRAPYAAVRLIAQAGEVWARVRLNDAPLTDNRGGFHVYFWRNAKGQHLGQFGVHVAQPIPRAETGGTITDYRGTGRAFPRGMHSISPYAVRQAPNIGNCWQVGALAALAHTHPHVIREMIDDHQDGTYTVRIYDDLGGRRVSLLLDSNFPNCVSSGIERDGSRYALWPALLQKAHFFMNGFNYKHIGEGDVSWVPWDDLTNVATDWILSGAEWLRDWLKKGVCRRRPMVGSTYRWFAWDPFNRDARIWNLIRDHVYAFLDCSQTGGPDGDWQLYLLNPHRCNVYQPGQARDDRPEGGDGFFWIPMSKAGEAFAPLFILPLPDSHPKAEIYRLDANGQLVHAWTGDSLRWDVITPVRWAGKAGFLCHRYQDKEASLQQLDPNTGSLAEVWHARWTYARQIIVPVTPGGQSGIFSMARTQNGQTGADETVGCLERFGVDGSLTSVTPDKVESGWWDGAIPFSHGSRSGFIRHRYGPAGGPGEIEIWTVDAAGRQHKESSLPSEDPAWDVMVPLSFGRQAGLLSHAFAGRRASLHMLDDSVIINDNAMQLATWWRAQWAYHWEMIVPVSWGAGSQGVLSYDLDTGTLCLDRFNGSRSLVQEWRRSHGPAPHLLASVQLNDTSWLLSHTG